MRTLSVLILPATLDSLGTLIESATSAAEAEGVSQKKLFDIELALEEALVNVINYAYPQEKGNIEVVCKSADGSFIMEIIDKGVPFDVLSVPTPDLTADISDRRTGGLGVYFMRKLMDYVGYRREDDKNILEMKLRID
jgi:anti-sigma regulatory factor (Ser/Thr protein kinase)